MTAQLRVTYGLLGLSALLAFAGCASSSRTTSAAPEPAPRGTVAAPTLAEWPPDAVAGECYAKVFMPAKLGTVSERVCIREACERVEIIPARYEWVEERVTVKDASSQLIEVPAEYRSQDRTVQVEPGQTGWVMKNCPEVNSQTPRDVFCYVNSAPVQRTIQTQRLVTASGTREVAIPAEYQTVRRQKLMAAATTKKIAVPAEYQDVERSVALAPGHMAWQRVMCEATTTVGTANAVKAALLAAGYSPGPQNGELNAQDWAALKAYQANHGLAIGGLSDETLSKLQVAAK